MPLSKKKNMWIGICLSILVVACLACITYVVKERVWSRGDNAIELYYMSNTNKMKSLEMEMTTDSDEELILQIIKKLQSGMDGEGISPTIPEGVEVQSILVEEGVAYLDFTSQYHALENVEEILCRTSLVWSLTSIKTVNAVELSVDGEPLVSKSGDAYGLLHRQNVLIDAEISPNTTEFAILKLYFANEEKNDLIVEDRVVEVIANQAKELTILEQLIVGPEDAGNVATMPEGTKILDVTITGDAVCYVNLSQEFVANHSGNSSEELLTVYAIVNSLAELDGVEKVQFLVEGEKMDVYKGDVDFSTPFVPVNGLWSILG